MNAVLIFKSFIKHTKNSIDNFNKRIDIFYNNQLISDEEYIKYKKVTDINLKLFKQ